MAWWSWLVVAVVCVLVAAVAVAGVQARRRSGTVLAVRRRHATGRRGAR
ncbi:hypothetical protein [Streptomyces sp. NPDC049555]